MNSEGYLSELFSSIQGEGGTVRGSCFGKRQIFIRFSGCNIAEAKSGCLWCDTPHAQKFKYKSFKYEEIPGSQELLVNNNPAKIPKIIEIIKKLITPDLHSISFTGGEPLCQISFMLNIVKSLKAAGVEYPLYLETNGTILPDKNQFNAFATDFNYCCCDIKDRSSRATLSGDWKRLVDREVNFIEKMVNLGIETYAKIVITSQTKIQDIKWISKIISEIKYPNDQSVGLAIQPVTLKNTELEEKFSISLEHLNNIFYTAAEFLSPENLTLSIQAHKFLNLL